MSPVLNRYERILRLLTCLQSGPRYNAVQLAGEMQVSRRTVFRDIGLLKGCGIPVCFDEEHGRYHLSNSFTLPKLNALTGEEVTLLLLAAHLSIAMHIPEFARVVRRASAKMLSGFAEEQGKEIAVLLNACALQIPVERPMVQDFRVLELIFRAIRGRRQVRLSVSADPPAKPWQTKVAPYQITVSGDHWSLVGRSADDRCTRTFDLRSVQRVEVIDEPFVLPRGYQLHAAKTARKESVRPLASDF